REKWPLPTRGEWPPNHRSSYWVRLGTKYALQKDARLSMPFLEFWTKPRLRPKFVNCGDLLLDFLYGFPGFHATPIFSILRMHAMANAKAYREPPRRGLSASPAPQRGGDAVVRLVRR